MQKLIAMVVAAFGDYLKKNPEILDRAVDRLGDRLTEKLPDLSDLDDQIVAKLPDLSGLPEQVIGAVAKLLEPLLSFTRIGSIKGGLDGIGDLLLGIRNNKGLDS